MKAELPAGWEMTPLSDLGRWTGGGTPSKGNPAFWVRKGIPWVSPKDMKRSLIDAAEDHISKAAVAASTTNIVPTGSILMVTRSGILSHSLPVAKTLLPVAINQDLKALVAGKQYNPDFLLYAFRGYEESILRECRKSGTTVANLDTDRLLAFVIPVPPLAEQHCIVSKLDNFFKYSQRARSELDRIPRLIERYKHAVLSAAFRGILTKDDPIKWRTVTLGEVLISIEAGKNIRCEERPPRSGERGIVKISSVTWGEFDPRASKTAPPSTSLDSKTLIQPGDFLISRANTLELVGACVIVGSLNSRNLYLSDKVLRLRFKDPIDKWVMHFLRSEEGRRQIQELATGNQLSMRNISQGTLRAIRLPLPPREVRDRILATVEKALSSISVTLTESKRAADLLDRLEAATLAKAFSGELVASEQMIKVGSSGTE